MQLFKTKYRIQTDCYSGFEVVKKPWYSFFWSYVGSCNTFSTVEEAKKYLEKCKPRVVYEE